MATTRIIPQHTGVGKTILSSIKDSLEYDKTRDGKLISYYECNPKTASCEFVLSKQKYNFITGRKQDKKHDIILYQLRQSFKPGTIEPEEANRISYELAMRFTKGNHAFIVATHEDKKHIHSHIYFNSTNINYNRKFKNFLGSASALRRLSDQICIENGLTIIENPKPSKGNYGTWLGDKKRFSNRDILKEDIDIVLKQNPKDFEEFLQRMESNGYTIKRGKNITFLNSKFKKPIRFNSLKGDYTEENIKHFICRKKIMESKNIASFESTKVSLLIDIVKIA